MADDHTGTTKRGIAGFGLDVVDLSDFSRLLHQSASPFLSRYFTERELADVGDCANRGERLAGRFAAKEAVMKALGVGFGDGIAFRDVEITSHASGAPSVELHRTLRAMQSDRGIAGWMVTISHTATVAVAGAIALS